MSHIESLIDFILNLAGLLLWLNWLAFRIDPLARTTPATLAGTLRKTDFSGPKRWEFLAGLALLLLLRAVIYWEMGPTVDWIPSLQLGAIDIPFRSDFLSHMLLFSLLGFVVTLAIFYLWLLLLSAVNCSVPDTDPWQKLVRLYLGWVEKWPRAVKLLLPLIIAGLLWLVLQPLLARLAIVPHVRSASQLLAQAAWIGLAGYLGWKYLIVGILLLHLFNSYVYVGNHPFWNFINASARHLLAPLHRLPLRAGRVDFAPLVAIALIFLVTEGVSRLPTKEFPAGKPLSRFLPF